MTGVRWTAEDGWLGQCDECLEWQPLDAENWYPKHGLRQCRFCLNASQRLRQRRYRLDPVRRAAQVEAVRASRLARKEAFQEYQRRWYRDNRDRLLEYRRERYRMEKAA